MSLSSLSYWPHSSAVDLSIGNMASAVLHNGIPLHVFHINVDHVVDLLSRQPPRPGLGRSLTVELEERGKVSQHKKSRKNPFTQLKFEPD